MTEMMEISPIIPIYNNDYIPISNSFYNQEFAYRF